MLLKIGLPALRTPLERFSLYLLESGNDIYRGETRSSLEEGKEDRNIEDMFVVSLVMIKRGLQELRIPFQRIRQHITELLDS